MQGGVGVSLTTAAHQCVSSERPSRAETAAYAHTCKAGGSPGEPRASGFPSTLYKKDTFFFPPPCTFKHDACTRSPSDLSEVLSEGSESRWGGSERGGPWMMYRPPPTRLTAGCDKSPRVCSATCRRVCSSERQVV